ncbi:MAG TPA: hypothetical protein VND93_09765, partial [Myxococcales bacterium]|nr:hypothetical protein [Myxococcales bacterium]
MRTRRSTMTAGRTDQALPAVRRRAAAGVRALQRSAGNQALAALIRRQATPDIQRDDVRPPEMKNDVWMGDDEGPLALPGHKFISDPYDHTVVVVNPDGTGVQYTYEIVQTDSGPREKLYHTEKLSKMRVDALARLDKAAPGETQEDTGGPGRRKKADHAEGEKERRKWEKAHPAEFAEYQAKLAAYQAALDARSDEEKKKKPPPPPPAPKGYPADKKTTLCTNWPGAVYHSAGGSEK